MKKLSATDVNAIKKLYENGVSVGTISTAFNVDPNSIRYHVNEKVRAQKIGAYIKRLANSVPEHLVASTVYDYIMKVAEKDKVFY